MPSRMVLVTSIVLIIIACSALIGTAEETIPTRALQEYSVHSEKSSYYLDVDKDNPTLYIVIIVSNIGKSKVPFNVTVEYQDLSQTTAMLDPGDSESLTFTIPRPDLAYADATGDNHPRTVTFHAYPGQTVGLYPTDLYVPITINQYHGLDLLDLQVVPNVVNDGALIDIQLTVNNTGNHYTTVIYKLYVDGKEVYSSSKTLTRGFHTLLHLYWTASTGNHTITAEVVDTTAIANGKSEIIVTETIFVNVPEPDDTGQDPFKVFVVLGIVAAVLVIGPIIIYIAIMKNRKKD